MEAELQSYEADCIGLKECRLSVSYSQKMLNNLDSIVEWMHLGFSQEINPESGMTAFREEFNITDSQPFSQEFSQQPSQPF